MPHSEAVTAALTANEPADGTKLIVQHGGDWHVIWRDDTAAANADAHPDDCWFSTGDGGTDDPVSLYQHLKYADAVYALGEKLASF